jgi:hypothetical protein
MKAKKFDLKATDSEFTKVKITGSESAEKFIRQFYGDDLEIFESFFILLLNRANETIGYAKISQGGIVGTVVDIRLIAKYCIDCLSSSVILAHNHPSGELNPSQQDIALTKKTKEALKLLEVRGALKREAKRNATKIAESNFPKLWILTPTASKKLLSGFHGTLESGSLPGIYYLPESFRAAIIVIHQLPPIPETLWLSLLGRGTVQKRAIDELAALPSNQPYVKITLELLYNLQQNLRINQSPEIEAEDRELIMRLAPLYQQERELARQEGLQEGEQRGLQQGEQLLIIRQLNRRIGTMDSSLIQQVQELPVAQLEELGEALLDFTSVTDLQTWLQSVS